MTLTLTKTLLGSTSVPMPSLVLIGPAVRPAIGNRQTDKQINKHIAFYVRLRISSLIVVLDTKELKVYNVSSGLRAESRLEVTVTRDTEYVCSWSTEAGAADNLTCIVSAITGISRVLSH